jgi:hypothetical protein
VFDKVSIAAPKEKASSMRVAAVSARDGNSGRRVGFGSDTITTRHDYF